MTSKITAECKDGERLVPYREPTGMDMSDSPAYRTASFDIATTSSEVEESIKIVVGLNHSAQRGSFPKEALRISEVKYIGGGIFVLQDILRNHLEGILLTCAIQGTAHYH